MARTQKGSLYTILGVRPTATTAEIRAKYKQLMLLYCPDQLGSKDYAEICAIQEAYEVLSNPKRRARYDAEQYIGVGAQTMRARRKEILAILGAAIDQDLISSRAKKASRRTGCLPSRFSSTPSFDDTKSTSALDKYRSTFSQPGPVCNLSYHTSTQPNTLDYNANTIRLHSQDARDPVDHLHYIFRTGLDGLGFYARVVSLMLFHLPFTIKCSNCDHSLSERSIPAHREIRGFMNSNRLMVRFYISCSYCGNELVVRSDDLEANEWTTEKGCQKVLARGSHGSFSLNSAHSSEELSGQSLGTPTDESTSKASSADEEGGTDSRVFVID